MIPFLTLAGAATIYYISNDEKESNIESDENATGKQSNDKEGNRKELNGEILDKVQEGFGGKYNKLLSNNYKNGQPWYPKKPVINYPKEEKFTDLTDNVKKFSSNNAGAAEYFKWND